jgi:hypothetical protein
MSAMIVPQMKYKYALPDDNQKWREQVSFDGARMKWNYALPKSRKWREYVSHNYAC